VYSHHSRFQVLICALRPTRGSTSGSIDINASLLSKCFSEPLLQKTRLLQRGSPTTTQAAMVLPVVACLAKTHRSALYSKEAEVVNATT